MWVVKLGGSLWQSPCLLAWLDRLAGYREPVVVVPGGGPFADQVRAAQAHWRFDDRQAHAMALHAMEQMARMYCALRPDCVVADSADAMQRIHAQGGLPVWLPATMVLRDTTIEADWSMTSDSLSLWLARRLSARGVVLVKSAPLTEPAGEPQSVYGTDLLDACFERYRRTLPCPVRIVHREQADAWPAITAGSAEGVAC
jgi:aspartokinase-like uncharacterized kinase